MQLDKLAIFWNLNYIFCYVKKINPVDSQISTIWYASLRIVLFFP